MAKLIGTGGGSSKLVNSKAPKREPVSRAIRPGAADMIGGFTAFKNPTLTRDAVINLRAAPATTLQRSVLAAAGLSTAADHSPRHQRQSQCQRAMTFYETTAQTENEQVASRYHRGKRKIKTAHCRA